ncbi:small ribosomal subunit protein uS15m isoform X2 [Anomaloglossus baeobatrachus]|uniref:small ribosomal subunit protein uS15m isoform X2 n=1 Tax=Anomaloglossus baeobatrachus TaxID=238106 RepID=UPI003F4F949A
MNECDVTQLGRHLSSIRARLLQPDRQYGGALVSAVGDRRFRMFALRTAVGRGIRLGCSLVSAQWQPCFGGSRALAAGGPSQLDDLPPTMFKKEYHGLKSTEGVNDIVKRLLSLDMASQSDKLKIKVQQLVDKVRRSPDDSTSSEVRVAALTARIQNFKEHLQNHPKDKANKRRMLMSIDRRKKLLKFLRRTRYDSFEHVCSQLGIEYTFPPEYYRRATKRWIAKKAFCLQVYKESKILKEKEMSQKKKRFPKAQLPLYVFPQPKN